MAVPTRRQVMKRDAIKKAFEGKKEEKTKSEPVSEEEHEKRVKMLREMGVLK